MRIAFCDDNPEISQQLDRYLTEYFQRSNMKPPLFESYRSGEALLLLDEMPDIVFLDVEMPGLSGIHIGEKIKERNPYTTVIILTSHPDYLDEAMRFHVFRYLSKPIDKNRLFRNFKDALNHHCMNSQKIAIDYKNTTTIRRVEEIIYVEGQERDVIFKTVTGDVPSTTSLNEWMKILDRPCFASPYRGYIVNLRYVSDFDDKRVVLRNGTQEYEVYMARRKRSAFREAYLLYIHHSNET